MTPEQIALVQSSFAKVEPIAQTAADLFYNRLFELEPGYRSLFPDDISEQKQKLMAMLAVAVKGLGQIEAIVPAVMKLGERHAGYGVTRDQYPTVGSALLWTLDQGLGDDFTPDVEAAWIAAYTVLADTMVAGKDKAA